jgi:hypothetical protein
MDHETMDKVRSALNLEATECLIFHKFPLNGRGQALQKGFQANLQTTGHGPFIPELEFTERGILPFHQIFRPTALGSLEEGLARARLGN